MLTILGHDHRGTGCAGARSPENVVSRRGFLKIGGMAAGGLSLAQLLEAQDQSATGRSHKAVINIFMPGGPSHIDLWDLKPDAPKEIRGEFRPIQDQRFRVSRFANSSRAWRR